MGGDIVYIVSKNAFFAGPNNIAYGASKADQAHQVRLLAAELGAFGIRVNGVNPDGVVRGSGIFAKGWGADRAPDLRHPRGQARRVLRPAHDPQARGAAGARRRRGVRADGRRPEPDDGPPHPGRRRSRRRVPAVSGSAAAGRLARGDRPRGLERARHRRPRRARRPSSDARGGPPVPQRPGRAPRRAALGHRRAVPRDPRRPAAGRRRGAATSPASRSTRGASTTACWTPAGALVVEPFHYRDARTDGVAAAVEARVSRRAPVRRARGLQFLPFNTLYQLTADATAPRLDGAPTDAMIPDLIGYWLTGELEQEETNASTTGCSTGGARVGRRPRRDARPADLAVRSAGATGRRRSGRSAATSRPETGLSPDVLGHARRVARHGLGGRRRPARGRPVRLRRVRDVGPRGPRARRADPDRGQPARRTSRTRWASTGGSAFCAT